MKKVSKNVRGENRGKVVALRKVGDKEVEAVLYMGIRRGHGKYMAAAFKDGSGLVKDSSGKPIPYAKI